MNRSIWIMFMAVLISGCCIGGLKKADVDPSLSVIDFKSKSIGKVNVDFKFEFNCCLKGKAKEQVEALEAKMVDAYNGYYDGKIDEKTLKEKVSNADFICQAIKSHWCDNTSVDSKLLKRMEIKGLIEITRESPDYEIKVIDMAISQL